MAFSGAVPKIQDYNKGHLGKNNFNIGYDFSQTESTLQSIFKTDFPEHKDHDKASIAQRPRLGDVMHKDERIPQKASETAEVFQYQPIPKPVLLNIANKLSYTNFKMDSDTTKINSFQTTHKENFKPKLGEKFEPLTITKTTQKSCIHQGDREKADLPISDYKLKFPGIDTNKYNIERASCKHNEGPPTIKGDGRLGHHITVSRTQFEGKWAPKVPILPVPFSKNVPVGDPEKENTKLTVMQSSFADHNQELEKHKPFDSAAVSCQLRKTNFKERDGHGTWDIYETTASSAFPPKYYPVSRNIPLKHRNASDLPAGDRESIRDKERLNLTTSRFHHGNPALGLHNRIVSGANKRTSSNVCFGDPAQENHFYSTSTKDVYGLKSVPFNYSREKCYVPSCLPLNYYEKSSFEATAANDYKAPYQNNLVPRTTAIESLKSSHIHPPQQYMMFDTTHKEEFKPKKSEGYTYDSGRLQKSSVPLGTMAF